MLYIQHVAGSLGGGHAVKLLGWGVDQGVPYWLAANSWNTDWGEDGELISNFIFFYMKENQDSKGVSKFSQLISNFLISRIENSESEVN